MIRRIITIDREKCNGCGACVHACHEGAVGLDQEGKAILLRDDYCDGLGDCLPACPTGAITFETREALPYDEGAVLAHMAARAGTSPVSARCPGRTGPDSLLPMAPGPYAGSAAGPFAGPGPLSEPGTGRNNEMPPFSLAHWPVQMALVPENAPFFAGADLLVAADCTAFAYGAFQQTVMRGKTTLIGCPKLDAADYSAKLSRILAGNDLRSLSVARMSVPCCKGLEIAAAAALQKSGKALPFSVLVISPEGRILDA